MRLDNDFDVWRLAAMHTEGKDIRIITKTHSRNTNQSIPKPNDQQTITREVTLIK
ncbi:MAG: hypothetical protein ACKO4K_09060 [Flavobacteriales bacterium]